MIQVPQWFHEILKAIGADGESLGRMNKGLKWAVVIILALTIFFGAIVLLIPDRSGTHSPSQSVAQQQVQTQGQAPKQQSGVQGVEAGSKSPVRKKFGTFLSWVAVGGLGVALLIEPKEPKRDGRFKTGYKNNATVRRKTVGQVRIQRYSLIVAAISGVLWYLVS